MIMRLLDRGADKQREALGAFGTAALHVATAHQHRNAPLDAGTEALALLECLAARRLAAPRRAAGTIELPKAKRCPHCRRSKRAGPKSHAGGIVLQIAGTALGTEAG
jgi:hypothetical protein